MVASSGRAKGIACGTGVFFARPVAGRAFNLGREGVGIGERGGHEQDFGREKPGAEEQRKNTVDDRVTVHGAGSLRTLSAGLVQWVHDGIPNLGIGSSRSDERYDFAQGHKRRQGHGGASLLEERRPTHLWRLPS